MGEPILGSFNLRQFVKPNSQSLPRSKFLEEPEGNRLNRLLVVPSGHKGSDFGRRSEVFTGVNTAPISQNVGVREALTEHDSHGTRIIPTFTGGDTLVNDCLCYNNSFHLISVT